MKNHQVEVKFSKDEIEKVKRKAEQLGLPLSSFIRFISLSAKIEVST